MSSEGTILLLSFAGGVAASATVGALLSLHRERDPKAGARLGGLLVPSVGWSRSSRPTVGPSVLSASAGWRRVHGAAAIVVSRLTNGRQIQPGHRSLFPPRRSSLALSADAARFADRTTAGIANPVSRRADARTRTTESPTPAQGRVFSFQDCGVVANGSTGDGPRPGRDFAPR